MSCKFSTRKGRLRGMSCKFEFASSRSNYDPEVRFRASAPKTLRCLAQLLQHAQRVQLTIRLVHENEERT